MRMDLNRRKSAASICSTGVSPVFRFLCAVGASPMSRFVPLGVAVILLLASAARAELPFIKLSWVTPQGAKIGVSTDVSVAGGDLEETRALVFSHAGIVAKPVADQPGKFNVTIAADVPPGVYDVRVVGRFGVSNPRAFVVDDRDTAAVQPADAISAAPLVPLDAVMYATAAPRSPRHVKFAAKKGQRLLITCEAKEIDSRLDPAMTLLDMTGRELDRDRLGRLIDFTAPADGEYVVRLHDHLHGGGPEHFFRLCVRSGPYLDGAIPMSVTAGKKNKITLIGRNLPGAPATQPRAVQKLDVEIDVPTTLPVGGLDYRLRTAGGSSNAVKLFPTTLPVLSEVEPNDELPQMQRVTVPCEISGQFNTQRDKDSFSFDAKKGAVLWIELLAHRIGVPCDPFLLIQRITRDDEGEWQAADVAEVYDTDMNVAGAELRTSARDPAHRLEVKEDGTYRVTVRDLFTYPRDNPVLGYRLLIRPEMPDFRLVTQPQAPPPQKDDDKSIPLVTTLVRKGGVTPVKVVAYRREGFAGPIELSVEGLPQGVTCEPVTMDAGATMATLLLNATMDAASWVGELKIIGRGRVGEKEIVRTAEAASVTWGIGDPANEVLAWRPVATAMFAVSDAEPAPLALVHSGAVIEVPANGKARIPLDVVRRSPGKGKWKLKVFGHPAVAKLPEIEIDEKARAAALQLDLAQQKLPPGEHVLYVRAYGTVHYWRDPDALKAAEAGKQAAESAIAEAAAAIKSAAEAKQAAVAAASAQGAAARKAVETLAAAATALEAARAQAKAASPAPADGVAKPPADAAAAEKQEALHKALEDISQKLAAAREASSAAEKAVAEQIGKATAAADKASSDAAARQKEAEARKGAAEARIKELSPRDVAATYYSQPIRIRVLPPPPAPPAPTAAKPEQPKKDK